MRTKLLNIIALIMLTFAPAAALAPAAYAASSCGGSDTAKGQVLGGIGETGTSCSDAPVKSGFQAIVEVLSLVVGGIAIIMIIVSGFRYITSNGDSARVTTAKNTLIFALIGVAVAALAQILVQFVVNKSGSIF